MMQSLFGGGELGLLGGSSGDTGGLKEDSCGSVAWNSSTLPPDDVYSTSNFALITAYQDIKTRLACLERENTTIKRKLKMYEIKVWITGSCKLKLLSCGCPTENQGRGGSCLSALCSTFSIFIEASGIITEIKGEKASVVFDPGRVGA